MKTRIETLEHIIKSQINALENFQEVPDELHLRTVRKAMKEMVAIGTK